MLFKKAICIALTLFSLSTVPSSLKRDASSCNFEDAEVLDSHGAVISLNDLPAATPVASVAAIQTTPNSLSNNAPLTPQEHITILKKTVPPLTISPEATQKTTPKTPDNSFAELSAHSEPPLSTRSLQASTASVLPSAITSNPLAISAHHSGAPQQIPVEAVPPITPIATPRPNSPAHMAASLTSYVAVASGFLVAESPDPVIQSSSSLAPLSHAAAKSANEPSVVQCIATNVQLSRLHPALAQVQILQAAQHPMQLPQSQLANAPTKRLSGDVSIPVAPTSPGRKEDVASQCCLPITCCGKQVWSGTIPTCPKMNCTIL